MAVFHECGSWCSRKTWVLITVELSLTVVAKHREMGALGDDNYCWDCHNNGNSAANKRLLLGDV